MTRRNLYRVFLRGAIAGPHYVVANTTDDALQIVVDDHQQRNYGFSSDRVLDRIELVAEDYLHTRVNRLYVVPVRVDSAPQPSRDDYGDGK